MKRLFIVCTVLAVSFLSGCDSPQSTVDKLRKEIIEFQADPDPDKQVAIEKDFVKLEEQVNKAVAKGDDKANTYKSQLASLRTDYQAAKMAKAMQDAKNAIQGFGEAAKDGVKNIGEFFKGGSTNTNP